jgi:hypothetical protein
VCKVEITVLAVHLSYQTLTSAVRKRRFTVHSYHRTNVGFMQHPLGGGKQSECKDWQVYTVRTNIEIEALEIDVIIHEDF